MARKIDHAQRKREVTERALKLFSQVGYENVSLIMIAAATGISRTILYRYFCSKREVMDAAIQMVLDEIEVSSRQIIAGREPALPKLEKVCHTVAEIMFKHRDFVTAVFDFVVGMVRTGADMNRRISESTAGTRQAIRRLVDHAKRRGELPENIIPERITDAFYAEFESCAMRILLGTERDAAAAKVRFSDIIHAISRWE